MPRTLQRNGLPPLSSPPSPSQEGSSESERPHATYRALASATYPLRIRYDTATCPGAPAALLRSAAASTPRCCAARPALAPPSRP
eukprot:scaffold54268_cov69-Phaeocystis_antarctica.AAC.3